MNTVNNYTTIPKNVIKIKSGIAINVDGSVKNNICGKHYIWNPVICSCKNGKYLTSTIDNSAIMCGEIIEETKAVPTMTILYNKATS